MSTPTTYSRPLPGIDILCDQRTDRLRGRRVGLVSHAAAMSVCGSTSAERLARVPECQLVCLMGPEHGFFGTAAAGASCKATRHPILNVPVYSLYGTQRTPTAEMLEGLDTLVVDLQDLSLRCYTYVSTLALVLEAAAEAGIEVIVTDRPTPFADRVSGPVLDGALRSFVGQIDTPFMYGMTPAETARWLKLTRLRDLDLDIVPCETHGQTLAEAFFRRWPAPPPSPALATPDSILCYPATVFLEAFGSLSHGRGTPLAFQTLAAPWLDGKQLVARLRGSALPGIKWFPHPLYLSELRDPVVGVRVLVADPASYNPILTAVHLLQAIQKQHTEQLWEATLTRPGFLDKLAGSDTLRTAMLEESSPEDLLARWEGNARAFRATRAKILLYPRESTP